MSRTLRSATRERLAAALLTPIPPPSCRPVCWRSTRPLSSTGRLANGGSRRKIFSGESMRRRCRGTNCSPPLSCQSREEILRIFLRICPEARRLCDRGPGGAGGRRRQGFHGSSHGLFCRRRSAAIGEGGREAAQCHRYACGVVGGVNGAG